MTNRIYSTELKKIKEYIQKYDKKWNTINLEDATEINQSMLNIFGYTIKSSFIFNEKENIEYMKLNYEAFSTISLQLGFINEDLVVETKAEKKISNKLAEIINISSLYRIIHDIKLDEYNIQNVYELNKDNTLLNKIVQTLYTYTSFKEEDLLEELNITKAQLYKTINKDETYDFFLIRVIDDSKESPVSLELSPEGLKLGKYLNRDHMKKMVYENVPVKGE